MPTIDNTIYDRVADTWWEQDGFMALLRTAVNPPRLAYFTRVLARQSRNTREMRLLDVGCGGGLLAEGFARLGCTVTGIDQSVPSLVAARAHAAASGLSIDYREGTAEQLPFADASFDIVSCCDVLEHVDDVGTVIAEVARVLKPDGVFLFDTINRTLRSYLVAIKLAQDWWPTRMVPRDVHVWRQFIRPDELAAHLNRHGLELGDLKGLAPPAKPLTALRAWIQHKRGRLTFAQMGERLALVESGNLAISYMGFAAKRVTSR
ncbi:bifunctional 2-polyprenyl-6-hydroxyphenol methylase/3-demethylubiquinol 3-O-methyltransferase UbiG [Tahibacter amnicola]|uniref:Bifunctional 2-polyprenyl-6-hydroxyphenol methylase/3-demethylubiquinol 3-O-methyltransferase UbiG n=1 Tax=Tahibacter amnicola TaxID=2976241 RepID=A0ABY6B9I9_9GAMM|nr:bifunctional 2-polyprenyl-6-hydroxyphenol methylase/3-demethylubiquinol 3-O-methyltransferase UbiG [Tahibacter amnicola]UXI65788.1 bifunctional 2-polyprenyl-6-hydroxyphenol methylase/3-demethylubiquinol 3-O-methyltransferase UbiG [Tahibacter amnicola]